MKPKPLDFLDKWAHTRRIVSGRRVVGHTSYGAPVIHYTTPEAVAADFIELGPDARERWYSVYETFGESAAIAAINAALKQP